MFGTPIPEQEKDTQRGIKKGPHWPCLTTLALQISLPLQSLPWPRSELLVHSLFLSVCLIHDGGLGGQGSGCLAHSCSPFGPYHRLLPQDALPDILGWVRCLLWALSQCCPSRLPLSLNVCCLHWFIHVQDPSTYQAGLLEALRIQQCTN